MTSTWTILGERRTGTTATEELITRNYPVDVDPSRKHIPPSRGDRPDRVVICVKSLPAWIQSMKPWWPDNSPPDEGEAWPGRNAIRYLCSGWSRYYRMCVDQYPVTPARDRLWVRHEDYAVDPEGEVRRWGATFAKRAARVDLLGEHAAPYRWQSTDYDPAYYWEERWRDDLSHEEKRYIRQWLDAFPQTQHVVETLYPDLEPLDVEVTV